MARQTADRALKKMRFVGIDPGEAWTGIARANYDPRSGVWVAEMRVLDSRNREFVTLVNECLLNIRSSIIIAEEYRQRPVGHQRFAPAVVPQLLGALRYVTEESGCIWRTVPAGDPDKELDELGIGKYIREWQALCPYPNHANWHHARSAWRVLARYLASRYAPVLAPLFKKSSFRTFARTKLIPVGVSLDYPRDLTAPIVTWKSME